jgi:23S rRNA (cytosine1962-C5)-methyltransferase
VLILLVVFFLDVVAPTIFAEFFVEEQVNSMKSTTIISIFIACDDSDNKILPFGFLVVFQNNFTPDFIIVSQFHSDDAMKFVAREKRRGHRYNGIVLDPPSFGRGAQGQVWKIEDGLAELLDSCKSILDLEHPFFILLSCHSQGFSATSLGRILAEVFPAHRAEVDAGEMLIPEAEDRFLPAGLYARIFFVPGKKTL